MWVALVNKHMETIFFSCSPGKHTDTEKEGLVQKQNQ